MDLAIDAHGTYPQRTETDLIGYLLERDGIIRIEPLDADLTARLLREEESITNVSGGLRIEGSGSTTGGCGTAPRWDTVSSCSATRRSRVRRGSPWRWSTTPEPSWVTMSRLA